MKRLFLLFAVLLISSCEKDDSIGREDVDGTSSELSLLNNRIIFDSKKDLKHFLETHKDIDLDKKVGKIYSKGFKPLTPFGMEKGTQEYADFIAKKKIRIEKK